MIIQLCEDDGMLHEDGKPRLVVLMVQTDDGKTHRIPYQADHTITELYETVRRVCSIKTLVYEHDFRNAVRDLATDLPPQEPAVGDAGSPQPATNRSNTIEREDVVECVKIKIDESGSPIERDEPVVVGKEYRVINIIRNKDRSVGMYEVLDDESNNKIRIPCFPEEIVLKKKYVPGPPRKMIFDEKVTCPACASENVIRMNDSGTRYEGNCEDCGQALSCERPTNQQKTGDNQ